VCNRNHNAGNARFAAQGALWFECLRMDISFSCPHCDQHLAVDETGAGMTPSFHSLFPN